MEKLYTIYYAKPEHVFRTDVTLKNLLLTHVSLTTITSEGLEDVFCKMQGEVWSPNGEARNLIGLKGLNHTSMSCGDVICDVNDNKFYVVENCGFSEVV